MKHTKEPWEVDHRECDGVRYFVVLGPDGKTIMDTMNSESQLIEEDFDEDGFRNQWDEQGRLDLKRASACVNACAGIADPSIIADMVSVIRQQHDIVVDAIMHGMPITAEVANARNLAVYVLAKLEGKEPTELLKTMKGGAA